MLSHPRLHSEQKMHGLESFKARILADQEKIEHDFGARFSELMKLPYFDCVRMTVITCLLAQQSITKNI